VEDTRRVGRVRQLQLEYEVENRLSSRLAGLGHGGLLVVACAVRL
jgi:hypothetical protein